MPNSSPDLIDLLYKAWLLIFIPVGSWLNKKRKEYNTLLGRVKKLEEQNKSIIKTISEDRTERRAEREDDLISREQARRESDAKLDNIKNILMQVKEDTAVNKATIDNKK